MYFVKGLKSVRKLLIIKLEENRLQIIFICSWMIVVLVRSLSSSFPYSKQVHEPPHNSFTICPLQQLTCAITQCGMNDVISIKKTFSSPVYSVDYSTKSITPANNGTLNDAMFCFSPIRGYPVLINVWCSIYDQASPAKILI